MVNSLISSIFLVKKCFTNIKTIYCSLGVQQKPCNLTYSVNDIILAEKYIQRDKINIPGGWRTIRRPCKLEICIYYEYKHDDSFLSKELNELMTIEQNLLMLIAGIFFHAELRKISRVVWNPFIHRIFQLTLYNSSFTYTEHLLVKRFIFYSDLFSLFVKEV